MDIVRFKSGLGNQMFQYAFLRALQEHGRKVKASLGYYTRHPDRRPFVLCEVLPNIELDYVSDEYFDYIDNQWQSVKRKGKKYLSTIDIKDRFFWVEESDCVYFPDVFKTTECVFVGYWQTEKYFAFIKDKIQREFVFSEGEKELAYLANIISQGPYISVHIRRGDYLPNQEFFGNISETQYYENSIDYIRKNVRDTRWIVFSDDIQWAKANIILPDAIYVEREMFQDYKDWYDMYLMSCCQHNIIANSSFSWWGAWLNRNIDKIIIAPQKWFKAVPAPDICPDEWVRMS